MVLIDTNVLLDIATRDRDWFEWSSSRLAPLIDSRTAAINPIIYAELAPAYRASRQLDLDLLPSTEFRRLPLPYSAAFPAARAFAAYRNSGGRRNAPLPDFFIGGHAEAEGLAVLTRDPARYRTYFPGVRLLAPE